MAAIVDSFDDAIISKSLDGTILSWNKSAERLFGYTGREIIGRSIRMLIPPDLQEQETNILLSLQETGKRVEPFSTVRLTHTGNRLDVMVSISPMRDESGKLVGAFKIVRNLSEQRRAEEAIRDSEARFRGVVDSASDMIITITEGGAIESINQTGLSTFGYSRDELVGQNIRTLMPDANFAEYDGDLLKLGSARGHNRTAMGREVTGRRKDGSSFPVELAVSQVQLAHRRLYTCIGRDITQRKEAERALVDAKEAAEAANDAKEHFLSILSHELRTPLTPALAELSFLEEDTTLASETRSRLKMVRRNIETEARLVDDLLDMTRISQGKIHLHYEAVDLHETIRASVGMFQAAIDAKVLEITLVLDATQHHVWADAGRIQQILLNLVSNAVKFTPASGRITIRSSNDRTGVIAIEVCDNGVGIEPEMLQRIFSPFEQSNRTRRLGGLGLGLSIAKSLAELHLGKLMASSEGCDRGATFRLELAMVPPPQLAPFIPTPMDPLNVDRRILLVEDDDDTRTVLSRLLRSVGCQVTVAADVRQALAAGEAENFDLLIADISLPDGSGLEVMKKLKPKIGRGIALSGLGQPEDLRKSCEAGFETHLTKPISFGALKELLQRNPGSTHE